MIIIFNYIKHFFNGLFKFFITNTSTYIKCNSYFCFMTSKFTS